MTKKILLIIGILVIIGIALFLVFGSKPQTPGDSRVGFSIRDFLPFGKSNDTGTSTEIIRGDGQNGNALNLATSEGTPRLRKLSTEPVAGAVIFNPPAGGATTSLVRFIEKGTGNVYEARSDTLNIQRLTNTTIPKIIRAFWLPNASGFLAQTLMAENEVIETNFVKLNKNTASSTTEILTPFNTIISKLPTDIKEITIKPDGTKIFYYTNGGSISNWFVANPDGTNSSLVMSHPLTEWSPQWITGNTIVMQPKASSASIGSVYTFDIATKVFKKIGLEALGLSSNPNLDGSLDLISSGGNLPQLFLVNNKTVTAKNLNVNTLTEKCIWLKAKNPTIYCAVPTQIPGGNYPDVWYKGLVSTEDFIQKIDINNDIFYNTADLSALAKQKIDVTDLSLSPDETHLIFRNKIDGFLWMLRIEE
jgi:hypothetical protein